MDAAATITATTSSSGSEHHARVHEDPNPTGSGLNAEASVGGARYKLMSPAKLPISRSACITIPPGLSPTSFLESPVLLSNMKVEPSPTTGSLPRIHQTAHGSMVSAASTAFPITSVCFHNNTVDDRKLSFFEYKPPGRSNMVPSDFNNHESEQSSRIEGPGKAQPFASSPLAESEPADPSNELSLSSPVQKISSVEVDLDEFNHKGNTSTGLQASHVEVRGSGAPIAPEKASDDGYNWRKYGQKLVKGSEFPRSYYKCTHPNCEVKKLFERSHDGQITEIIYKGTHDHPKPQPSRRYSAGTGMSVQEERSDKASLAGQDDRASGMYGRGCQAADPNSTPELSPRATNDDSPEGAGFVSNRTNDEVDDDDPFLKRRRMELGNADITPVVKPIREPRVVVQTLSEVDILDDGYRWRKYGQKVVRGNPNPRSYYKCTNAGCPVRKHVERASHDPKAVITTYEGKHNHDVPAARSSSHDMAGAAAAAMIGHTRIKLEESDTISLDLGMGISSATENRSKGISEYGESQSQIHTNNNNFKFVHTSTPAPAAYFGVLNHSSISYGSRENRNDAPSLNHSSYPCSQNMGRILTGP
ncbi:probable WRKY transcription factor 20 isoform X1 [Arachis ipaensis]|uniref:probable WRKY transcription factor 20 isoform X1 n=2 Tax=Arachis ipaensis TaxID=130454 RepID=UPI0007AFB6C7|nr:probable WRKY transcription factor 20 isoform X1 [Arachis ipaensis]